MYLMKDCERQKWVKDVSILACDASKGSDVHCEWWWYPNETVSYGITLLPKKARTCPSVEMVYVLCCCTVRCSTFMAYLRA